MSTPGPRDFPHLAAAPMPRRSAVGRAHRRQTVPDLTILFVLAALAVAAALSGCGPVQGQGDERDRAPGERYTIGRVVDGDTVLLLDGEGGEERVRVQGIDTPETHARSKLDRDVARAQGRRSALDRETIRRLGKDASAHAARLLVEGRDVRVVSNGRDKYGRLVGNRRSAPANIEATDDFDQPFDFGGRMVSDGYAHAYSRAGFGSGGGRYPHERMDYSRRPTPVNRGLERQARDQRAGLWADGLDALTP